jgi:hypothetical protein
MIYNSDTLFKAHKITFCRQCLAAHGDVGRHFINRVLCRKCRGLLGTNGHGATPCAARAAGYAVCSRGLLSVRRSGDPNGPDRLTSPVRYAADMLRAFGHSAELVRSNYAGSTPAAFDCWTTREGIDDLVMIQAVARSFLSVCNPAGARLLLARPDVFEEFRTLWRLDAPRKVLEKTLEPLNALRQDAVTNRLAEVPKLRKRKPCR